MISAEEKAYYKSRGIKPPKYGMSTMWKDIIWGSLFLIIFLTPFYFLHIAKLEITLIDPQYDYFLTSLMAHLFSSVLLCIKFSQVHEKIGSSLGVAYKIVERDTSEGTYYYAKVFRPAWIMFFWLWKPVDSWKESYDSVNSAMSAITKYKRTAKEDRAKYNKRPRLDRVKKIRVK